MSNIIDNFKYFGFLFDRSHDLDTKINLLVEKIEQSKSVALDEWRKSVLSLLNYDVHDRCLFYEKYRNELNLVSLLLLSEVDRSLIINLYRYGFNHEPVKSVSSRYSCTKRFNFASAHFLLCYEGKCRFLHGHEWVVDVTFHTNELVCSGTQMDMVIDFGLIKRFYGPLFRDLDHELINIYCVNPTAENICKLIYFYTYASIQRQLISNAHYLTIKLWESRTSYIEVSYYISWE